MSRRLENSFLQSMGNTQSDFIGPIQQRRIDMKWTYDSRRSDGPFVASIAEAPAGCGVCR
jgi:hypothetical protein